MNGLAAAVWAELLKARRSRVPAVTVLAFTVAALVGGLFMFILQDQRRARALGLLGAKASLAGGAADWPTYLGLLAQTVAVGGLLLFGLVFVWIFGREFAGHTVKDLLAPPPRAPRSSRRNSPSAPPGASPSPSRPASSACSSAPASGCPPGRQASRSPGSAG